jgi:transposase-like protein
MALRWLTLGDPLLVVSEGAPGVIKAIETCFPRLARQRCLAQRTHNLAAKVPEDKWPELKAHIEACYRAPSRATARKLARGAVAEYGRDLPSAVVCVKYDFQACIAQLPVPVTHRRATWATNLLERLFFEECRRLKIVPNAFGERPVRKLLFGALTRAADRWRTIKFTDFERRQIAAFRQELNQEYQAQIGRTAALPAPESTARFSSSSRT